MPVCLKNHAGNGMEIGSLAGAGEVQRNKRCLVEALLSVLPTDFN